MKNCPVTGSTNSSPFYSSVGANVMTSDQRIIKGKLNKIIFNETGIVANEASYGNEDLNTFYGKEYVLNSSGNDEHIFFLKEGRVSRSQIYYSWIKPFLNDGFDTLVEIGCGEGRVLEKIASDFPNRNLIGFDGSHRAVELAKNKGLNVSQKLLVAQDNLPKADIYLLIGVIEHIENLEYFLTTVIEALEENGKLIICIPIQDYGGYDIFFSDHIWHFTVKQFKMLLNRYGLRIVHLDTNHPVNHGFGLFVCERDGGRFGELVNDSIIQWNSVTFWNSCFDAFNKWAEAQKSKKIAVFGAGEILTLFMAYTSLSELDIIACIDDTKQPGDKKHGIPIHNSDWLKKNAIDILLLSTNRRYHQMISETFNNINLKIQPIY